MGTCQGNGVIYKHSLTALARAIGNALMIGITVTTANITYRPLPGSLQVSTGCVDCFKRETSVCYYLRVCHILFVATHTHARKRSRNDGDVSTSVISEGPVLGSSMRVDRLLSTPRARSYVFNCVSSNMNHTCQCVYQHMVSSCRGRGYSDSDKKSTKHSVNYRY